MAVSGWRCLKYCSCLVPEAASLGSPKTVRRPGGFLKRCWSSVYVEIPKDLVLILVSECRSSKINGLVRESDGKQAEKQFPSSITVYMNCHQKVQFEWVFLLQTSNETSLNRVSSILVFS